LEDALKILSTFVSKWKLAAAENKRRRAEESQTEARRAARALALGVTAKQSFRKVEPGGPANFIMGNNSTPEDDIFIACSPRIVRRSYNANSNSKDSGNNNQLQTEPHSLPLPSPGELFRIFKCMEELQKKLKLHCFEVNLQPFLMQQ